MTFVNDHLQNFPYSNMPAFCVGLAPSYDAPSPGGAGLMRIPPRKIAGRPARPWPLLEAGLERGIDFAYSHEIDSWDELAVPLHFLTPEATVAARAALHELRGAAAADAAALPRGRRLRRRVHPLASPARSASRLRRDRRHLALGRHARDRHGSTRSGTTACSTRIGRGRLEPLLASQPATRSSATAAMAARRSATGMALLGAVPGWKGEAARLRARRPSGSSAAAPCGCTRDPAVSYALNKVLTAVARQHAIVAELTDADLAGYDLSRRRARTALQGGRHHSASIDLGANPYLIRRVFRARFRI